MSMGAPGPKIMEQGGGYDFNILGLGAPFSHDTGASGCVEFAITSISLWARTHNVSLMVTPMAAVVPWDPYSLTDVPRLVKCKIFFPMSTVQL